MTKGTSLKVLLNLLLMDGIYESLLKFNDVLKKIYLSKSCVANKVC